MADKAFASGQITPQQREQIALAVAEIKGCSYSLSAHPALGQQLGLSGEELRLARKAAALDPQTKARLHFTQEMNNRRHLVPIQSAPRIHTPRLPRTPEQISLRAQEIHKARGG